VFPALVGASTLRPEVVEGIDLLVVRELTGGLYFGEPRGQAIVEGRREARNTMVYDEIEIARIAKVAFESARRRRREVTHVHKANVLEVSQLWVQVVEEVAKTFRSSRTLVDSVAMLLWRAGGLRRDRHREPVRRHPLRQGRGCHGLARHLPRRRAGRGRRRNTSPVRLAPVSRARTSPLAAIPLAACCSSTLLDAPEGRPRRCGAPSRPCRDGFRTADLVSATTARDRLRVGDRVLERLAVGRWQRA
jgi:3-isopropylmalate dehydrogenase